MAPSAGTEDARRAGGAAAARATIVAAVGGTCGAGVSVESGRGRSRETTASAAAGPVAGETGAIAGEVGVAVAATGTSDTPLEAGAAKAVAAGELVTPVVMLASGDMPGMDAREAGTPAGPKPGGLRANVK